ncbi:hypothetical protein GCM10010388_74890 [Streptomyces mauvecolor]
MIGEGQVEEWGEQSGQFLGRVGFGSVGVMDGHRAVTLGREDLGAFDEVAAFEAGSGRELAALVTLARSRTVAKVDSMGFVVRKWIQCLEGKS